MEQYHIPDLEGTGICLKEIDSVEIKDNPPQPYNSKDNILWRNRLSPDVSYGEHLALYHEDACVFVAKHRLHDDSSLLISWIQGMRTEYEKVQGASAQVAWSKGAQQVRTKVIRQKLHMHPAEYLVATLLDRYRENILSCLKEEKGGVYLAMPSRKNVLYEKLCASFFVKQDGTSWAKLNPLRRRVKALFSL